MMSAAPTSASTPLAQFQRAFAAGLWRRASGGREGDEAMAKLLSQPAFAVYRNTVMKGCIDTLEANFPAIARLVGADWFRAAAALFVQAHPPTDSRLVIYGESFADFLQGFEPAAELPYLPNVARLDRCWTEAHVAADKELLPADAVARMAPEQLGALVLEVHPAARWAWFEEQPIYTIWSRNRVPAGVGEEVPELAWQGEGALLTRPHGAVVWCEAGRADIAFLDSCAAGEPVAHAAEAALAAQSDADLSAVFARLLAAGAFTAASLAAASSPR
ncbi:MAG: DNA-binding domain-containing protein [Burkholderiales bacterium]